MGMTTASEQSLDYQRGYAQAIKDVQQKFLPLWHAVQHAVAESHRLDSFISVLRRSEDQ